MFIIIIITCVEHPYLAEDGGQDVLVEVPHLPDQALGWTPERDHQVRHGQIDQVVVHRGPGREEARKDKAWEGKYLFFLIKIKDAFCDREIRES